MARLFQKLLLLREQTLSLRFISIRLLLSFKELDEEAGHETEKVIKDKNQSALFVRTDVSQEESVRYSGFHFVTFNRDMVKQAEEKFGGSYILLFLNDRNSHPHQ